MKPAALHPRLHLFVCTNARPDGHPLGPGCGERGERLFAVIKKEIQRRGQVTAVWATRTGCLGQCPPRGATVARYPCGDIQVGAEPSDAAALLELPVAGTGAAASQRPAVRDPGAREEIAAALGRAAHMLEEMETLQSTKVIDLARRIHPGITAEDIRNPHDFPDLDDPDWHFADGQLSGIQSVRVALRQWSRDLLGDDDAGPAAQDEEGQT